MCDVLLSLVVYEKIHTIKALVDHICHWTPVPAPVAAPTPPPEEEPKDIWVQARSALIETTIAITQEYTRLSWRFTSDPDEFKGEILTSLSYLISLRKSKEVAGLELNVAKTSILPGSLDHLSAFLIGMCVPLLELLHDL